MQITIELLNDNALNLIYDLEKMHIIRLIKTENVEHPVVPPAVIQKPTKRFAGRISKERADELQGQLKASREEWKN